MAKQTVSVVERHLEKGVLGITGVVFLAALAMYGLRSPNTVEFEGQPVAAGEIDQKVREAAEALRRDVLGAVHKPAEIKDRAPEFEKARELLASADLSPRIVASVAYAPRVPNVGVQPAAGEILLAPLVTPAEPRLKWGRSYVALQPAELGGDPLSVEPTRASLNWVTIGALFDRAEQARLNTDAGYRAGMTEPYFIGLAVQRRQQNSDGSWTEWKDINPYVRYEVSQTPQLTLTEGNIPPAQVEQLIAYIDAVGHPYVQVDLMRPLMAWVLAGDPWLYPKFEGIDVFELDQPYYQPTTVDRYPKQTVVVKEEPKGPPKPPPSAAEEYRKIRDEAKKLLEHAGEDKKKLEEAKNKLNAAKELVTQVFQEVPTQERQLKDIDALLDKAEERIELIARKSKDQTPTEKPIAPVQVVWASDAVEGSVEPGKTYQYRLAFRMLNRYAGRPGEVKNRDDATKVVLQSDWSPPSDPITIEPEVKFFLATATSKGATVKLYKWYEGVWIDADAEAKPGQRIFKEARTEVPGADGEPIKQLVTFDGAAEVIEIDPNRPFRKRKPRGADGFTFDETSATSLAMIYRDSSGELHERLLEADKFSEEYKRLKEDAYNPTKKVKKNEPPPAPPGGPRPPQGPRGKGGGGAPRGKGGGGAAGP